MPEGFDWKKADKYARNRVVLRLIAEAELAQKNADGVTVDEYAYRAAVVLLSREAANV